MPHGAQKRASIAYKDSLSSFENLLLLDNSVTVHRRNHQRFTKQEII